MAAEEAALIQTTVGRRCPQARTLLDVACGTGAVTAPLSRAYQVSGATPKPSAQVQGAASPAAAAGAPPITSDG